MFFRQHAAANATLSYFFGCAGHQKAVAVDVVAGDEDWFVAEADKAGVRIAFVIDTHVHADHYSGARNWPVACRLRTACTTATRAGSRSLSARSATVSGLKPATCSLM